MHLDLGFHGPGTVRWLKRVAAQERDVCEMPTARRAAKKVWGWGIRWRLEDLGDYWVLAQIALGSWLLGGMIRRGLKDWATQPVAEVLTVMRGLGDRMRWSELPNNKRTRQKFVYLRFIMYVHVSFNIKFNAWPKLISLELCHRHYTFLCFVSGVMRNSWNSPSYNFPFWNIQTCLLEIMKVIQ